MVVPSNKKLKKNIRRRRTYSGFVPEIVEGYNRVCIGNLAWDTTERDIHELFSGCVINSVLLGKNKETGEFKGCAHVYFNDILSVAMSALKLDQIFCNSTNRTPGKIKRRTCYVCREKGHLATACGKKLKDSHDQANAKVDQETVNTSTAMLSYDLQKNNGGSYCMNETYTATNEAHSGRLASEVSFGETKRRTCYECREKGHLAKACLKKLQNTGHTNAKVDHQTVEARPIQETNYNFQKISGDTDNNGGSYMDETYVADPVSVVATNGTSDGSSVSAVSWHW
ncbi:phragmoplastin interacting protein 1-like [Brassica napus]|nr:phragmoplastin interacting protein 1-like [Brassica napus]